MTMYDHACSLRYILLFSIFSLFLEVGSMCVHYHTNHVFTPAYAMSIHALISDHVYTIS